MNHKYTKAEHYVGFLQSNYVGFLLSYVDFLQSN